MPWKKRNAAQWNAIFPLYSPPLIRALWYGSTHTRIWRNAAGVGNGFFGGQATVAKKNLIARLKVLEAIQLYQSFIFPFKKYNTSSIFQHGYLGFKWETLISNSVILERQVNHANDDNIPCLSDKTWKGICIINLYKCRMYHFRQALCQPSVYRPE